MILITNRQRKIAVDVALMQHQLSTMISILGYKDFDVGVLLTTNAGIRKYNRDFRDKDKPTDILSFPYHPDLKAGERIKITSDDDKNLGDIIISLEYVQKKASDYERTFNQHLLALLAHGIAHLLNYDHISDEDFVIMQQIERKLLKAVATVKK